MTDIPNPLCLTNEKLEAQKEKQSAFILLSLDFLLPASAENDSIPIFLFHIYFFFGFLMVVDANNKVAVLNIEF